MVAITPWPPAVDPPLPERCHVWGASDWGCVQRVRRGKEYARRGCFIFTVAAKASWAGVFALWLINCAILAFILTSPGAGPTPTVCPWRVTGPTGEIYWVKMACPGP